MPARPLRPGSFSVGPAAALAARLVPVAAWLVPLASLVAACNAETNDDGFDFSTESNGTAGSGGSSEGTTGATTGSGTTDATTAPADSGSSTGGSESSTGELPVVPCTGVDLVFVLDDSEPMLEEQIRLRSSALAFVQQIVANIPTLADGINIGVITTDDELFVQANAEACGPYEGGNNWMLSSSTVLQTELECALNVGVAGSPNERPMDMLIASLADENLMPGGFHAGFLRDEALLVVVLVTNEEDDFEIDTSWGSAGDPADWVAAVAERKGGYERNVVVLSLLGIEKPNACPDFQWDGTEGAQVSPRLGEFTQAFPQGAVGDICEQEYATFLLGVVPGVVAACGNYSPP
jgi:hypothetical protein